MTTHTEFPAPQPQLQPRCQLSKSWAHRPGAGLGINQGHVVGSWQFTATGLQAWIAQCRIICGLADEPEIGSVAAPQSVPELCRLLSDTIGALQRYAKIPVDRNFSLERVRRTRDGSHRIDLALPTFAPNATVDTMCWLFGVLNSAEQAPDKLEASFYVLQKALKKFSIDGENHWRIIQAALDTGLPVSKLAQELVILGSGRTLRAFHSFTTDRTSHIGVMLAQNKFVTSRALLALGLPGAVNVQVTSREQAEASASSIGFPVVVKPADRDRGEGVAANLVTAEDVSAAFDKARAVSELVLVEKYQAGFTHRLTVVEGQTVRVTKHIAFGVYGDGVLTVEQLVAKLRDELLHRKKSHRTDKALPTIDDEADSLLRQEGRDRNYVPAAGEYVRLRRKDNISAGGVRETLDLEEVHPDNLDLAVRATRALSLDIAGIDLITEDITVSWLHSKATICEVNAKPQVVARDNPEMYKIILRGMFEHGARVPATLHVVDDARRAEVLRICRLEAPERHVSDISGTWLGDRRLAPPFRSGFEAARAVVIDKAAEAIVSILSPGEIEEQGLPLEKWDDVFIHLSAPALEKVLRILRGHTLTEPRVVDQ